MADQPTLTDLPDDEPTIRVVGPRYVQLPEELLYDPSLTATAVRVYGALRRHGEDPSRCYPSHRRLGDLLGLAPRSLQRPIKELEKAGWIKRLRRWDANGGELSCSYDIYTVRDGRDPERDAPRADQRVPGALSDATNESQGNESKKNEKETAGAVPAARAPGKRKGVTLAPNAPAPSMPTPQQTEAARSIVSAWWEAQDPRPTNNYLGVVQVVSKLIAAGWPLNRVAYALADAVAPTNNAMLVELNRDRRPSGRPPLPPAIHDAWRRYAEQVVAPLYEDQERGA